jgi:hypothetical protein
MPCVVPASTSPAASSSQHDHHHGVTPAQGLLCRAVAGASAGNVALEFLAKWSYWSGTFEGVCEVSDFGGWAQVWLRQRSCIRLMSSRPGSRCTAGPRSPLAQLAVSTCLDDSL